MRRWGVVVSCFYLLALLGLFSPAAFRLMGLEVHDPYGDWGYWLWLTPFVGGEALLLFLTVDTSRRRLRPRTSLWLSVALTAFLLALLTLAAVSALTAAAWGDHSDALWGTWLRLLGSWAGLWVAWGVAFHRVYRERGMPVDRAVSWLLRGSVVELLVAVPCHAWVRRRDECSAPMVTGFGIATGIAIMLLSFGPGMLFLVKKRLEGYRR